MNVFVLCTGRSGSTTFIKACSHIVNYTSAHESRTGLIGDQHFKYPENHIEADNRLSWFLGRLDKIYGNNAMYVHLKRNTYDTAKSLVKRYSYMEGIIFAYHNSILYSSSHKTDLLEVCIDYCDTVNSNIEAFLKDKKHKMSFSMENSSLDFPKFWDFIGAKGDFEKAIAEWSIPYNPSSDLSSQQSIIRKITRVIKKLPYFIKNV